MTKQLALAILTLIILLILSIGWCTERKHNKAYTEHLQQRWANDTLRLTQRIKTDSSTLYQMQQRIGTEANARQLAQDDAKHYKSLLAVVKAKVGAQKNNVEVRYVDKPISINTTDTIAIVDTACIPVGTTFTYADKWFYTAGSLGSSNILLDSVGFTAGTVKVIIGNQRQGLFKRTQPTVSLLFENPNMFAHSANNIVVQDKRKHRRGWWLITGLAAGLVGGLLVR